MDIEKLAGLEPDVDVEAVEAEMWEYATQAPVTRDEPWRITTLGAANWAMRKVKDLQRAADDYRLQALRLSDAADRIARAATFFIERLEEWGIGSRTDAVKSFATTHGVVSTTAHKAKAVVDDEDALIAWLDLVAESEPAMADCVETKRRVRLTEWRRAVTLGELVVEWQAIAKTTGETQVVPVEPIRFTPERLAKVQAKMGDGFTVQPVTVPAVFYKDADTPVPGSGVQDAYVTASVKPA